MSHEVSNFYGTEIEIWAGFGPVASTEKNFGGKYEQLLMEGFYVFIGKKIFFNYCSVCTKKLQKMKVKKKLNFFLKK